MNDRKSELLALAEALEDPEDYHDDEMLQAATAAERHRIGKVTDTLLKSANEVLERVIAERDALRNALDKIAERTGSDDPCANYVQIARSALRVAAEIRKGEQA